MAEALLSVTLETLRDLLLEEARFLSGVGNQVREIQGHLEMMKSFLNDADQRQHKEERVRTWVKQVIRLAYRTEDVLETYAVEVVSKKQRGIKNVLKRFACILSEGKALHMVGEEIKNIKSEIINLNTRRETYDIKDLNEGGFSKEAEERQRLLRQTYAHEVDEHFVGRKDDIQQLVSLITSDEKYHRVISIWGMGGLGKTTLARKIFNNGVVQRSFEAFAWVCMTSQFQIVEVLQDILMQILGVDVQGVGDQPTTLINKLHEVLVEKKCLVVLDDVWDRNDWEILRHAFSIRDASSKVLLTTRTYKVAAQGWRHDISYLTEEEGLELLKKKAFNNPEEIDLEAEPIFNSVGKEILRKCGYLPLAVSVLGGVLRRKNSPAEWERVNERIDLYLSTGKGKKEARPSVSEVLGLSYDELPYYLKPCFLYMGSFREDEIMEAEKLYHLWIAEGLVLSEHCGKEETLMDVAERYLDELASSCLVEVQIDDMSMVQRFESCRLHDLIRDLCIEKGHQQYFFNIIDIDERPHPFYEVRRLGMYMYADLKSSLPGETTKAVKLFEQVNCEYIRTFFLRARVGFSQVELQDISNLNKLKLLKVLDLENCQFELPKKISQLIHLRYLGLRGSIVKKLPSSISNLPYLQTLDLRTKSITYLPNIFCKMQRLKHIYLPQDYSGSEKLQFYDLSELETLHFFVSSGDEPINLSGLVNLRSFSGSLHGNAFNQIINQIDSWGKIERIKVEILAYDLKSGEESTLLGNVLLCKNLYDLKIDGSIGNFPSYESLFWQKLTQLKLYNTLIEEDPMQFLKKLPNLLELMLFKYAFVGKEMLCDATSFPKLRYLGLHYLPNLGKWRVDEGAMPNLSHLTIDGCDKLETITNGLSFSALERFDILNMPEEFKQKYEMIYDQERKQYESATASSSSKKAKKKKEYLYKGRGQYVRNCELSGDIAAACCYF